MSDARQITVMFTGRVLDERGRTPRDFKRLLIEEAVHQFKARLYEVTTSATTYPAVVGAIAPYVNVRVLEHGLNLTGHEWAALAQRDYDRSPIGMAEIFATALANQARLQTELQTAERITADDTCIKKER